MEKENKLRVTINKMFNSLRYLTIGIIFAIIIMMIFRITVGLIIPRNSTLIMFYKEAAYEIYNEGLLTNHYDSIKIETPNKTDVDVVVNQGLKYVTYKDLMNIEIEDNLGKIQFRNNSFRIYESMNIKYTEIIVDNEKIRESFEKYKKFFLLYNIKR